MTDTLDSLFNNGLSSEAPMPGTELDFFLDQLPINDTSTFFSSELKMDSGSEDKFGDEWEYSSDHGDVLKTKVELLSDGGSPDSSSSSDNLYNATVTEYYDDEEFNNVDMFLNKPAQKKADNDVMVNIPQRTSNSSSFLSRPVHRPNRSKGDDVRCSSVKGRDITEEERKMLEEDGVTIPYNVVLTKNEERALKKVRRKIKNKISAAESRKRRKEYIGGLETRVEECTVINVKLQNKVDDLQKSNRTLIEQLKRLTSCVKTSRSAQTSTILMGVLISFAFFFTPFNLPFATTNNPATLATSNYIPGRSLLSIPDESPELSFMETIVEYFVEKFEDLAFHENAPQMLFMDNKTIFIK